ncbi:MAG: 2-keto-D-gluconate dehydrogenase, partial [Bryobacteraceae bacterium]
IFPRTDAFDRALPVFDFPQSKSLRLWVLPFCLTSRRLVVPHRAPFADMFMDSDADEVNRETLSAVG